jgi:hypothetical protein
MRIIDLFTLTEDEEENPQAIVPTGTIPSGTQPQQPPSNKKPAVKPTVPPKSPATAPAKEPEQSEEPIYATRENYQFVQNLLIKELVARKIFQPADQKTLLKQVEYVKDAGRLPLLRISNVTAEQLTDVLVSNGAESVPSLTEKQAVSSGQFTILSFKANNILYTFVMRGVKTNIGGKDGIVLNRKDLTPVKLGLAGDYTSKQELIDATKNALTNKIQNPALLNGLIELVDIAAAGGKGTLTPESLATMKPYLVMVSQDFGEILAPIVLAQENDKINFPAGNEKLIDVTVGSNRYSVKAAGGSGTSMNSLGDLLDHYEQSMTDEGKKSMFQNSIKIWKSTRQEGSVTDRICLAANLNKTPEYVSYANSLGGDFKSFGELKALLEPVVSKLDYAGFLKLVKPSMEIGNWTKKKDGPPTAVGMPDDGLYYLGQNDKKPKAGVAGKYSYDHDPVDGAANIITYSLGKGIEFMITRGPNAQQYQDIMTDMVKQLNCWLGHVAISPEGSLIVSTKPFSQLKFKFDYHAPSHIAGNNRPGFMIVRD